MTETIADFERLYEQNDVGSINAVSSLNLFPHLKIIFTTIYSSIINFQGEDLTLKGPDDETNI
jgi:hypothetical protein